MNTIMKQCHASRPYVEAKNTCFSALGVCVDKTVLLQLFSLDALSTAPAYTRVKQQQTLKQNTYTIKSINW